MLLQPHETPLIGVLFSFKIASLIQYQCKLFNLSSFNEQELHKEKSNVRKHSYSPNFEIHTFANSVLLVLLFPLHSQLPRQLKVACRILNIAIKKIKNFKKVVKTKQEKKSREHELCAVPK